MNGAGGLCAQLKSVALTAAPGLLPPLPAADPLAAVTPAEGPPGRPARKQAPPPPGPAADLLPSAAPCRPATILSKPAAPPPAPRAADSVFGDVHSAAGSALTRTTILPGARSGKRSGPAGYDAEALARVTDSQESAGAASKRLRKASVGALRSVGSGPASIKPGLPLAECSCARDYSSPAAALASPKAAPEHMPPLHSDFSHIAAASPIRRMPIKATAMAVFDL